MLLTPENLYLVDAVIDDDPDATCLGNYDDCLIDKQTSPSGIFYHIADFPAGSPSINARLPLCANCLAADEGFTHDELVANRAELDAARLAF